MAVMSSFADQPGLAFDGLVLIPVMLRVKLPGTFKPTLLLTGDTPDISSCPWLITPL